MPIKYSRKYSRFRSIVTPKNLKLSHKSLSGSGISRKGRPSRHLSCWIMRALGRNDFSIDVTLPFEHLIRRVRLTAARTRHLSLILKGKVCKVASEASRQKTYKIGEVIADGDSDQVVVNTLADLFDVKKAWSTGNSAQLVGSMTEEALRHLAEKRYTSRFGVVANDPAKAGTFSSPSVFETQKSKYVFPPGSDEQPSGPKTRHDR